MKKILLYFNTIKYLKIFQIYATVANHFKRKIIPKKVLGRLKKIKSESWSVKPMFSPSEVIDGQFIFANQKINISDIKEIKRFPKLFQFNFYYYDFLLSEKSMSEKDKNETLSFLQNNFSNSDASWEPYVISRKIPNILIAKELGKIKLSDSQVQSLCAQAQYLYKNIEYHLDGNHLLSNAKGLIFSGAYLSTKFSKKWLKKGIQILKLCLDEQVSNDGSHFENSTMYHSIVLQDLLELYFLLESVTQNKIILKKLKQSIDKMIDYLHAISFKSGEIPIFNDYSKNSFPNLKLIKECYQNIFKTTYKRDKKNFFVAEHSRIINASLDKFELLYDCGDIQSNHIPGHTRSDPLSFEFAYCGSKIISNPGVSTYDVSTQRCLERSTKFHNTVCINDQNSDEIWKSFRVGRRSLTRIIKTKIEENCISLSGETKNFFSAQNTKHRREIIIKKKNLVVRDEIIGNFEKAVSTLILDPNIDLILEGESIQLCHEKKLLRVYFSGTKPIIDEVQYPVSFGILKKTKRIKFPFLSNNLKIEFIV